MLYLHGKGWPCSERAAVAKLRDAKRRYCAFYGAARWLAKQPLRLATLGSLGGELLQCIACQARLDFSEFHADDYRKPRTMPSRSESKDQAYAAAFADFEEPMSESLWQNKPNFKGAVRHPSCG